MKGDSRRSTATISTRSSRCTRRMPSKSLPLSAPTAPALKVRGKLLACMASHKSAEPGSLVVRIGFEDREALIADDPRTYYVKPHYQDYPAVLVRLALIDREALRDLLRSSWRTVTNVATKRRPRASSRPR